MVGSLIIALALLPAAFAVPQATADAVAPAATLSADVDGFKPLGCFVDTEQGTLSFEFGDSPSMTVARCVDTCSDNGFIMAGLTGGTQCWCGNIIKSGGTPATMDACSLACGGNANELCGGVRGQRILLYEISPKIVPQEVARVGRFRSLGCWSDSQQLRALHHDGGGSDGQTVQSCLATCNAAGFPLAGVEFGLQCFCGNAVLNNHLPTDGAVCDIGCAGNPTQLCGGLNAINIYHSGNAPFTSGPASIPATVQGWNYLGCTQDGDPRTIPTGQNIPIENMTIDLCVTSCAAGNFSVAGLQFGQECRCGNVATPPGPVVDDSKCELVCNGNANQFCGGPGTNLVYTAPSA